MDTTAPLGSLCPPRAYFFSIIVYFQLLQKIIAGLSVILYFLVGKHPFLQKVCSWRKVKLHFAFKEIILFSRSIKRNLSVSYTFCNNISIENCTQGVHCTFLICTMPEIKNVRIHSLWKTIHYLKPFIIYTIPAYLQLQSNPSQAMKM